MKVLPLFDIKYDDYPVTTYSGWHFNNNIFSFSVCAFMCSWISFIDKIMVALHIKGQNFIYLFIFQYSHMRDDHGLSALFDVAQKVVERKFKEMAFFVKWFLLFSSASYFPISGGGLLFYPYFSFHFFSLKIPIYALCDYVSVSVCCLL